MVALKYDSLDLKIVRILQNDGRRPLAEIARELNVPAGVVQARFAKMKKTGLIVGSTVIIDLSKVGMPYGMSIGIVARENEVEEVKRYLEGLKVKNAIIYVWITFGRYNIHMGMFLENVAKIFKIKQMIKLHPAVESVDVNLVRNVHNNYNNLDIEKMLE